MVSSSRKEIPVSSMLPKIELESFNFCPSLLGQKNFVRFKGELKKQKNSVEINWPLNSIYLFELQSQQKIKKQINSLFGL